MIASPTYEIGGRQFNRKADEALMAHYHQFCQARDAQERERHREFENLRMYAGVDNSQWPGELQNFLLNEGRGTNYGGSINAAYGNNSGRTSAGFIHLGQYNFVKYKLNGIAGSLVRNPYDASFVADESEQAELTMALQEAYMGDKDLMDWNNSFLEAYLMAMIYQSVVRIYPRTKFPADPRGNLAIECYSPGCSIIDPDWKNGRTEDMRDIFTLSWMTGKQISDKYKTKKDLIQNEINLTKMFGRSYELDDLEWNKDVPERHGDKMLVIEHSYLKTEKVKREFDSTSGTVFWEWMTDEQKMAMAQENKVDPTNIREITVEDDISYTYTMCPSLSVSFALLDTKDEFQVGRLQKIPLSTEWKAGKPLPMLDQLRDAQMEINKRVATVSHAAESSVTSGAYIDEAVFGMDNGKIEEFKANRRNPAYVAKLKAGSSRAFPNGIGELPRATVPPDLFQITNAMIDLMERLVPQPAASEGRTEKSGESGILFAQKVEVAKTMQMTLLEQIRQFQNSIGEIYFFMAKQLYGGSGRREIKDAKGRTKVVINDEYVDEYGETQVNNDFSALSRHRVVVSEAPSGVNNRLMQRELASALMQNFQGLPGVALQMGKKVIKSLDLDAIEKQEAEDAIALEQERVKAQTEAAIVNAQMVVQQAQAMQQQPQMPPGGGEMPQTGAPGEVPQGMPQEALVPPSQEPEIVGELERYKQLRGGQ